MTRSTEEVRALHREAAEAKDIEKLMSLYADDATFLTLDGGLKGKEAIRKGFFESVFGQYPDVVITYERTAIEGDIVLNQWSAEAEKATVPHGVSAAIVQDGKIQYQIEWFILNPKEE